MQWYLVSSLTAQLVTTSPTLKRCTSLKKAKGSSLFFMNLGKFSYEYICLSMASGYCHDWDCVVAEKDCLQAEETILYLPVFCLSHPTFRIHNAQSCLGEGKERNLVLEMIIESVPNKSTSIFFLLKNQT